MLTTVFLIEIAFLFILIYKYGVINPIPLGYIIFFLYAQAFFIDHFLIGLNYLNLDGFDTLYISDEKYFYLTLSYFTFFIGYSFTTIFNFSNKTILDSKYIINSSNKTNIIIIISILILLYFLTTTFGLTRYEKIDWFQSHKLFTITLNIIGYIWIILFLRKNISKKPNFLIWIITITFLFYAILSGGRELIVFIILTIMFLKFEKYNSIKIILIGLVLFLFLIILKPLLSFIQGNNYDLNVLWEIMTRSSTYGLTRIDPKPSIFLITGYFDENMKEFYNQFEFTYIQNTYNQFLRTLKLIEYKSLAEQTAQYFMNTNEKGKGYAFSGILESMLNFWYFGPFLLGLLLGYITKKINELKYIDRYKYHVLSIFVTILIFKLVRTELAVVLKIYLLPMAIAYFVVFKNSYKIKLYEK